MSLRNSLLLARSRNQVTLPSDQIKSIGVGPGDSVWITVNPDRPGSLVILNEEKDLIRY